MSIWLRIEGEKKGIPKDALGTVCVTSNRFSEDAEVESEERAPVDSVTSYQWIEVVSESREGVWRSRGSIDSDIMKIKLA